MIYWMIKLLIIGGIILYVISTIIDDIRKESAGAHLLTYGK